ncbi:alpha-N-acetylgalactosaminidase-like [Tiliqua scincoides]|uniref:alpha-N-acetylgalactosaminidase-like n=1 Tax=Tiliqua scincoides TaxID=71010 RepID=UPI0034627BBC
MLFLALGVLLGLVASASSLDNGLMRTPPMGWVPWQRFRCNTDCKEDAENCISEHLFKTMADRLVEDGWRALGYEYVNLDDCWEAKKRDAQGRLQAAPDRFPSGIKALADYIHSKGLKFGIYTDLGATTCEGFPGTTSIAIERDARTFAEWGVDMVKLDSCFSSSVTRAKDFPRMSTALNKTGRPIALSCSWPAYDGGLPPKVNYTLLGRICNLWRNYVDIQDSWSSLFRIIQWYGNHQDVLQPAAGPGRWNDPDMLLLGDFGLSLQQAKVQVALWAVLAAPLFISCNLRTISDEEKSLLQNPLMIYINQDPLGIQGRRVIQTHLLEVWKRPLVNKQYAIAIMNSATKGRPQPFVTSPEQLGISDCKAGYRIYSVLERRFLGIYMPDALLRSRMPPTSALLLLLRPLC